MQKIVYMEWVKLRPRAQFEISGSGVIPALIEELPEAREALELNAFNLYGYKPLLEQIAARYRVATSQVVTTQGTSMANYLAYAAALERDGEVLVEAPAYEPLTRIPELLKAKVRRFSRPFKGAFRVDLDKLAAAVTKRTRLIALTNMHNPSGVLEPDDVLREIGRIADKVGAYVLVDEVYLDFLFQHRPPSSIHLGENFIVTSSLTKVYGLDGLRCGWILASPKMTTKMWRLQDFYGVNGSVPAERASTAAFEHLDRFVQRTRSIIEANRPLVDEFMQQHRDTIAWVPPAGGPVCFPKLLLDRPRGFADWVRKEYGVGLIPGHFFEMPKHFRLGFGGPAETLREGLQRLGEALSHYSDRKATTGSNRAARDAG